jgi:hypothetical protein
MMNKTHVSVSLLFASLILLIIYGSDVFTAESKHITEGQVAKRGFLPISEALRGSLLGGGAVIMSIVAYVIGRKENSNLIGILLIINGGLIVGGMASLFFTGAATRGSGSGSISTIGSTVAMGVVLIALGILKFISTRKVITKKT